MSQRPTQSAQDRELAHAKDDVYLAAQELSGLYESDLADPDLPARDRAQLMAALESIRDIQGFLLR